MNACTSILQFENHKCKKMKLNQLELQELITRYQSDKKKLEFQLLHLNSTIGHLEQLLEKSETFQPDPESVVSEMQAQVSSATTTNSSIKQTVAPVKENTEEKEEEKEKEKVASVGGAVAKKKRGRGRPKGSKNTKKTTAKNPVVKKVAANKTVAPEPKRKPTSTRGYKLSEWDVILLEALKRKQHILVAGDFMGVAKAKSEAEGLGLSEMDLRGKINRSITKLTEKKNLMRKVPHQGKGYAYALNEWFDEKDDKKLLKEFERNS